MHLSVVVEFASEAARVRVIAVCVNRWVVNHSALEVEAAIAKIEDVIHAFGV